MLDTGAILMIVGGLLVYVAVGLWRVDKMYRRVGWSVFETQTRGEAVAVVICILLWPVMKEDV